MSVLSINDRQSLLETAVGAIQHAAADPARPISPIDPLQFADALQQTRATFVTLYRQRKLRGCRGSIAASEPLIANVVRSARAAAFFDERFAPVTTDEVRQLELHISILHPPQRLAVSTEDELLASLRAGVDGLILRAEARHALFLPSVWRKLPDPKEFLSHLKDKAGLPTNYWSSSIECERFTVEEFHGRAAECCDR